MFIFIIVLFQRPSEILPIVCIQTGCSIVLHKIIGTPYGFEVKNEKIVVFFVVVNKVYFYIFFRVRKGAKISILTVLDFVGIFSAKFSFVFIFVVQLFDFVVALIAIITFWAFLILLYRIAHFSTVFDLSTAVYVFVVVLALLLAVTHIISTGFSFKVF